jgi:hypothetical protein
LRCAENLDTIAMHFLLLVNTLAADNIMGIEISIDYHSLPARVFAYPEIAFVGQLSGKRIGASPLTASALAGCLGEVVMADTGILNLGPIFSYRNVLSPLNVVGVPVVGMKYVSSKNLAP